jgi:hypothetical protein
MPPAAAPNTQDRETRRFWAGQRQAERGRSPARLPSAPFLPVASADPESLDFADPDPARGVILWSQVSDTDLDRACDDPRPTVRARARRERNRRIHGK